MAVRLVGQDMLDTGKPDLVVAFPDGRDTADMVRRAGKAGPLSGGRALSLFENLRYHRA